MRLLFRLGQQPATLREGCQPHVSAMSFIFLQVMVVTALLLLMHATTGRLDCEVCFRVAS